MSILFDYQGVLIESKLPGTFSQLQIKARKICATNFVLLFEGTRIHNSEDFATTNIQADSLIQIVPQDFLCKTCFDKGELVPSINSVDTICQSCANEYPKLRMVGSETYEFSGGIWRNIPGLRFFYKLCGRELTNYREIDQILEDKSYSRKFQHGYQFQFSPSQDLNFLSDGTCFNLKTKVHKTAYPWDNGQKRLPLQFVENPSIDPVQYFSNFVKNPGKMIKFFEQTLRGNLYSCVVVTEDYRWLETLFFKFFGFGIKLRKLKNRPDKVYFNPEPIQGYDNILMKEPGEMVKKGLLSNKVLSQLYSTIVLNMR